MSGDGKSKDGKSGGGKSRGGKSRVRFRGIGVPWEIETAEPLEAAVLAAVRERVEAYDWTWSRFREDSLVARIGREPGVWTLPEEAGPLLELYRVLHEATGGRLSPLARRGTRALPWADAIAWDGERLAAPRPVTLDVAAAGKGQLIDLVTGVLREHAVEECTVDASGDLRHRGPAIRVALEHPLDTDLAVGLVEVSDGAVAASAMNRQPGHIVDALTGVPARSIIATWVVAPTAMVADGLATALFLLEDASAVPSTLGAEWVRMDADGRLERSAGFTGEVFA